MRENCVRPGSSEEHEERDNGPVEVVRCVVPVVTPRNNSFHPSGVLVSLKRAVQSKLTLSASPTLGWQYTAVVVDSLQSVVLSGECTKGHGHVFAAVFGSCARTRAQRHGIRNFASQPAWQLQESVTLRMQKAELNHAECGCRSRASNLPHPSDRPAFVSTAYPLSPSSAAPPPPSPPLAARREANRR